MKLSDLILSLEEGVLAQSHTPKSLLGYSKKNKPQRRVPQTDDKTYLAKHGVRMPPEGRDPFELQEVPPSEGEKKADADQEQRYLAKHGPVITKEHEPEDDYDDDEENFFNEEEEAEDELADADNYDFPVNSRIHNAPVGRLIAKTESGRLYIVKYVDYFSSSHELIYAAIEPSKFKRISGPVVAMPNGGDDFLGFVMVRNGRVIDSVFYKREAHDLLKKAYDQGLIQ